MRILVFREIRAEFAWTGDHWAGDVLLLVFAVSSFDRANDEGTDRYTRPLGPVAQPVVQRFRDIDSGADRHDMIMS